VREFQREFKTEKAWSDWLLKELKTLPNSWFHRPVTKVCRGIPDILGCVSGYFVAFELKLDGVREDKSRETLQKHIISQIKEAGSPIAIDRLTPSTWPEVRRKLEYLNSHYSLVKVPQQP
jgi:hypothetical protein